MTPSEDSPTDATYRKLLEDLRRAKTELSELEQERLDVLSIRDYAIGIEQAYGRSEAELEECRGLISDLRQEIVDTHARLAEAVELLQKPIGERVRSKLSRVLGRTGGK